MCLRLILKLKSSCLSLLSAKTKGLSVCFYVSIYMTSGSCRVRKGAVCSGIRVTSGCEPSDKDAGYWTCILWKSFTLALLTTELFLHLIKGFHFKQDFFSSGMNFIGACHDSLQLKIALLYLCCTLWALWPWLPFFFLWVTLMLDGSWMLMNKWMETLSEKLFLISTYRHGLSFKINAHAHY